MSANLTLNKITAQKGITIAEAASRVADLGWTPSYVQEAMTFPTDYKISKTPRDPMRQVLRSYFPMQEEKDNRVYGALDAALRGDMFRNVEPRWVEWMKLFLAIIPFPEISAARSMAMVGRLAPGEELRTGFTMQMVDELRHSTIQMKRSGTWKTISIPPGSILPKLRSANATPPRSAASSPKAS